MIKENYGNRIILTGSIITGLAVGGFIGGIAGRAVARGDIQASADDASDRLKNDLGCEIVVGRVGKVANSEQLSSNDIKVCNLTSPSDIYLPVDIKVDSFSYQMPSMSSLQKSLATERKDLTAADNDLRNNKGGVLGGELLYGGLAGLGGAAIGGLVGELATEPKH